MDRSVGGGGSSHLRSSVASVNKSIPASISTNAASTTTARRNRRRGVGGINAAEAQHFSSYLTFGIHVSCCLIVFLALYMVMLSCLFPLLKEDVSDSQNAENLLVPTHRGQALRPVVEHLKKRYSRLHTNENPAIGQLLQAEANVVSKLRNQFQALRQAHDLTDAKLLDQAMYEFLVLRQEHEKQLQRKRAALMDNVPAQHVQVNQVVVGVKNNNNDNNSISNNVNEKINNNEKVEDRMVLNNNDKDKVRNGFVVLGMHRSGTSMLSGLLVQGSGYNVGGPLIGGAADNEKGFFELVDAVLQNDEYMALQNVWWSANVINYNADKIIEMQKAGTNPQLTFKHGKNALRFLNSPSSVPWLQKDPRMCITLKTWLPILNTEPAVVFTYRHPLEVAYSLKKREHDFPIERGLRLWIIYNMRAIQNSKGLCRVLSSNEAILADPLHEVQRIANELHSKCNVPAAPREIEQADVDKFVDPNLQHNKKQREEEDASKTVIEEHENGCKVHEYQSDYKTGSNEALRERNLYLKAMKMYCDFQSGKAYQDDYKFPEL